VSALEIVFLGSLPGEFLKIFKNSAFRGLTKGNLCGKMVHRGEKWGKYPFRLVTEILKHPYMFTAGQGSG
jgi:hypothetical protein